MRSNRRLPSSTSRTHPAPSRSRTARSCSCSRSTPRASRVAAVARAKQQVDTLLARIAPDADTLAALSTICVGPCDYRRAYEEARQVMRCLTNLAATTDIATLAADDLGAGRLFLAAADRGDADRFARDTLGPLLDAEDPKVADLLSTLQVFFEAARSVRQTAVRLACAREHHPVPPLPGRRAHRPGRGRERRAPARDSGGAADPVARAASADEPTSPYRRPADRIRRIFVNPPNADADDPTREH